MAMCTSQSSTVFQKMLILLPLHVHIRYDCLWRLFFAIREHPGYSAYMWAPLLPCMHVSTPVTLHTCKHPRYAAYMWAPWLPCIHVSTPVALHSFEQYLNSYLIVIELYSILTWHEHFAHVGELDAITRGIAPLCPTCGPICLWSGVESWPGCVSGSISVGCASDESLPDRADVDRVVEVSTEYLCGQCAVC